MKAFLRVPIGGGILPPIGGDMGSIVRRGRAAALGLRGDAGFFTLVGSEYSFLGEKLGVVVVGVCGEW